MLNLTYHVEFYKRLPDYLIGEKGQTMLMVTLESYCRKLGRGPILGLKSFL